jgi:hypothetical protein
MSDKMNDGKASRKRARRNGRSPKKILETDAPHTPQDGSEVEPRNKLWTVNSDATHLPTSVAIGRTFFEMKDLDDCCKVLIDSSVKICCAPHAILFRYNLLEPKTWEDGPIEVTFANEKKSLSCFYVELGRNLLRVALVSEIRNTILSIKQTTERGMEVRLTNNRRCLLLRAGSIVADAKICSTDDLDYVHLKDIEPDLDIPLLYEDHRTPEINLGRERVKQSIYICTFHIYCYCCRCRQNL